MISILYYLGVMQFIVRNIGQALAFLLGTSPAESINAAGNIFVGMVSQTESPVMIQPFLEKMTKSELHAVMVGGFATIAGSVYGAYVKFGVSSNCNFSGLSDKLCQKEPRSCDFGRDPNHHHHHHPPHLFTH